MSASLRTLSPSFPRSIKSTPSRIHIPSQRSQRSISLKSRPPPPPPASHGASSSRLRASLYTTTGALLGGGAVVALLGAGYQIYNWLSLFSVWPKELRGILRKALKAEERGDFLEAEKAYAKAYADARAIFPRLPLLHTTGLAAAAANNLIDHRLAPQRALPILTTALSDLDSSVLPLTGEERRRRIGILNKLGEVCEKLGDDQGVEDYLGRAVTEGLKGIVEARREAAAAAQKGEKPASKGSAEELEDVVMPKWLSKTDVAACCDSLGQYYMRKQKPDYAAPLFLQAINTVVPPPSADAAPTAPRGSVHDRCRGAMIMSSLSSTLTIHPTSENLTNAKTWADRSLKTVNAARSDRQRISPKQEQDMSDQDKATRDLCDTVRAAALFNLGVLQEMLNEPKEARALFEEGLKHSNQVGYVEGYRQAAEGHARVQYA